MDITKFRPPYHLQLRTRFAMPNRRPTSIYPSSVKPMPHNGISLRRDYAANATPRIQRKIFTLHPDKILQHEPIDLTGRYKPHLQLISRHHQSPFFDSITYQTIQKTPFTFPPNSCGHFYFYHPKGAPRIAASIRFRKVGDGEDLLFTNGLPWQIDLLDLVCSIGRYSKEMRLPGIKQLLFDDHLVKPRSWDDWVKRFGRLPYNCKSTRTSVLVHSFGQEFYLPFDKSISIWTTDGQDVRRIYQRFWFAGGSLDSPKRPYTGSGYCRFEKSTLPEHSSKPTIVARITKILEPAGSVNSYYSRLIPAPKAGSLIRFCPPGLRYRLGKPIPKLHPWCYNSDLGHTLPGLRPLLNRLSKGT